MIAQVTASTTSESEHLLYGRELGANVVLPKRLLGGVHAEEGGHESLLRDLRISSPIFLQRMR